MRLYLNEEWTFCEEWSDNYIIAEAVGEKVRLPHTIKETPFHYFDESLYQMCSCYQKKLFIPNEYKGMRLLLTFEAVGHYSRVYVNGRQMSEHRCGYTAFTVDITHVAEYGNQNLITVYCDSREQNNQPPFGFVIDYMTFGGIYRDVYLDVKNPVYMKDVFYMPTLQEMPKTRGMSLERLKSVTMQGRIVTEIELSEEAEKRAKEHRLVICQFLNDKQISNQPLPKDGRTNTLAGKVHLWDIASPVTYELRTELRLDGETVDTYSTKIGFRKIEWKAKGFYLNGRKLKLRGLNRHQSYPYVGYAMPESMQREDARILKEELGCNAVRTSHYPQSHYFISECDRLGMVVFTEIPGWQYIGNQSWQEAALANTRDMVIQYRNHPSIVLWGVRINESKDDDELYAKTNEVAHSLDPTRPTGGVRCDKQMHLLEDVYTYNDFSHDGTNPGLESKKAVTPDMSKAYLVSEYNGHMYPTKSFDDECHRREQMIRHAAVLDSIAAHTDIAGGFGWCMFDYNTHKDFGSGDRICYHGVMDMFRNPKDAAYVYAAQAGGKVVLHVASSMDIGEHPASVRGKIYMISNADSIRMYKNDILLKEYTDKNSKFTHMRHGPIVVDDFIGDEMKNREHFSDSKNKLAKTCLNETAVNGLKLTPKVMAAAARLMAFHGMTFRDAYDLFGRYIGDWGGKASEYKFEAVKDGKVMATVVKSPMTSMHLGVRVSNNNLIEKNTYDVAAVRVAVLDEHNNVLPYYNDPLRIAIAGEVTLIGEKLVPFSGGQCGFYVRTNGKSGTAAVKIVAIGMEPVTIDFEIIARDKEDRDDRSFKGYF